jgi:hypothetical protein
LEDVESNVETFFDIPDQAHLGNQDTEGELISRPIKPSKDALQFFIVLIA